MGAISNKEALERMKHEPKGREYYEKEIPKAIRDFYYSTYEAQTVEEIAKCSQNTWVACMEFVRRQCINKWDLTEVREQPLMKHKVFNEAYNPEKVQVLVDVYLKLCFLFDKVPSVYSFGIMSGLDRENMESWAKQEGVTFGREANNPKRAILNIKEARAESLQNTAISGGRNTVGTIAVLNNEVWNDTNRLHNSENKQIGTLDDIPRLPQFSEDDDISLGDIPNINGVNP